MQTQGCLACIALHCRFRVGCYYSGPTDEHVDKSRDHRDSAVGVGKSHTLTLAALEVGPGGGLAKHLCHSAESATQNVAPAIHSLSTVNFVEAPRCIAANCCKP
jgi:hypothetical protein